MLSSRPSSVSTPVDSTFSPSSTARTATTTRSSAPDLNQSDDPIEALLATVIVDDPNVRRLFQTRTDLEDLDRQHFEKELARLLVAFGTLQATQTTDAKVQFLALAMAKYATHVSGLVFLNFLFATSNSPPSLHHQAQVVSGHSDIELHLPLDLAKLDIALFKHHLLSSLAFARLRCDLGRLLGLEMLEYVEASVREHLNASMDTVLPIHIEWDMPVFCREELESDDSLGLTLSISGRARDAWATTCCQYLQDLFPKAGPTVLKAVEGLRKRDFHGETPLGTP